MADIVTLIAIKSPWFIFVQKAFLMALFSGELIFERAKCWGQFLFQNGLGLTIKTAYNAKLTA